MDISVKDGVEEVVFKPNSKAQEEFLAASETDVLFGGSAGGGKSLALIIDPLRYVGYKDFVAMIYRENYPQLEKSIIRPAMKYYLAAGAVWKDQKKIWEFPSGAIIGVGYLEKSDDWNQYKGFAQCGQYFDEATNLHWENMVMLRAWNRSEVPGIPPYRRAASNPGGISHLQIKQYYVDVCPPVPDGPRIWSKEANMFWQPVKPGPTYWEKAENGLWMSRKFIPARVFDNKDLLSKNPEYLQALLSLPESRRKGLLEGDWNVFEGQFFDLRNDIHVIKPIEDMPVDMGAVRGGLDFGKTTVLEVAFRDYEGNIVLFAEYTTKGESPSEKAEEIAEFLKKNRLYRLLIIYDVTLARQDDWLGYEKSPLQTFQEVFRQRMGGNAPILIAVSKKKVEDVRWRIACNEAFKEVLRYQLDESGKLVRRPKFYVTTSCPMFISTVPTLVHDPDSYGGLDYDTKNDPPDHWYEAMKFALMSLRPPKKETPKPVYNNLDEYMDAEVFAEIHEKSLRRKEAQWTKI